MGNKGFKGVCSRIIRKPIQWLRGDLISIRYNNNILNSFNTTGNYLSLNITRIGTSLEQAGAQDSKPELSTPPTRASSGRIPGYRPSFDEIRTTLRSNDLPQPGKSRLSSALTYLHWPHAGRGVVENSHPRTTSVISAQTAGRGQDRRTGSATDRPPRTTHRVGSRCVADTAICSSRLPKVP